ncbi:FtsK/SpoIIIE domain-containing protein [Kineococcus sp. G2]|uniref:FtsK/SpoIIIE domain-containing protein n=1 Tax=Kineococcus sp. G2 TaxID=3127484 RepID=UPI00301CDB73
MRLVLTLVQPGPAGAVRDVDVSVADDAAVADLARALGASAGLWLGATPLEGAQPLRESAVRSGAVLGVGAAVPGVPAEPGGVVDVLVASGPGAGAVHRLLPGEHRLPQAPQVAVEVRGDGSVAVRVDAAQAGSTRPAAPRTRPLPGPFVVHDDAPATTGRRRRRRSAAAQDPVQVHAADAGVPLVHLDRRAPRTPTPWPAQVPLVAGDVLLRVQRPEPPDAVLTPDPRGARRGFNRPPRLLPAQRSSAFVLPAPPQRPEKQPLPWLLALAPLIASGALYWFTRSPYTLVLAVLGPVTALGTALGGRRHGASRHRRAVAEHRARTAAVRRDAYAALLAERERRTRDAPDPATLLLLATGPRARLWERRRPDPDWLRTRLGTADLPSEVTLKDPSREEHEGPLRWSAADVPVTVDLAQVGVLGVAGPAARRRALAAGCVAQAAVLASPTDLEVVVLGLEVEEAWDWVRWLPHARREHAPVGAAVAAGTDPAAATARLAELTDLLAARRAVLTERAGAPSAAPAWREVLVVLDGARALRALPGTVSLLQEGPALGVRLVCLDEDVRSLPEECRAVVDASTAPGTVGVSGVGTVEGVRFDEVAPAWCERLARALAPLRDSSSEDLTQNLPAASRLVDVLALPVEADLLPQHLLQRWDAGGRSTLATIGEAADGPHVVDVRADGPHGLVAGTTGSGKSELLQTVIASLAVVNRPDEFTFVLVDYKGGAAFADCAHLPHTVGVVTDLDGHLTARALASLGAELKHREHLLASAGAKDVEDYTAARDAAGGDLPPLPRLLIVIDEFAALVADLPDFVTGLVDIARRGRSLGVHLLLATQRPAGVVSAEIRSNTALRIALRVTDTADSRDVLDAPDAATVPRSLPGRAYGRSGTAPLVAFQAARVGGRAGEGARSEVAPLSLRPAPAGRAEPGAPGRAVEDTPTDLALLVAGLRAAAERAGVPAPRRPWLPALPAVVVLPAAGAPVRGRVEPLVLGTVDLPREQRRAPSLLDLSAGTHLGVVGAARSGRSGALRAVAGAVAATCHPADVHLYGIDCGGGALLPLTSLPHTGAVVTRDQVDRLARLVDRLGEEVQRRQRALAEGGFASLAEQRAHAPQAGRLPHLVVLLDRWEGFVAAFEQLDGGRLVDAFQRVMAEGGAVGVTVVLAVDRSGLVGRVSALLDDKLVLRTTDPSDLSSIGIPVRDVPAAMPGGRGFRSGPQFEHPVETQVALLAADPRGTAQVAALQRLGKEAAARHGDLEESARPFRVDVLPTALDLDRARRDFPAGFARTDPSRVRLVVGVGGDTLGARWFDLAEEGPGLLVAGPRRSGRSTLLSVLADQALSAGMRVGTVTARRSPLRELPAHPGLVAALTADAERAEAQEAFEALAPGADAPPSLLLVDDLELLGQDGVLADGVTAHLERLRDSGCAVVAAGTLEELTSMYRGPVVALKRQRTGVLLSPRAAGDGDLFGVRLSRSALGGPAGRGLLVRAGTGESVQVLSAPAR